MEMSLYHRKLYALLQLPVTVNGQQDILHHILCLESHENELKQWWNKNTIAKSANLAEKIAASSDCVNLLENNTPQQTITVKHPISGQEQKISAGKINNNIFAIIDRIARETDAETVFWWFWRFYPEVLQTQQPDILLYPAHKVIPDCPLHSYQSTVSALAGTMFFHTGDSSNPETPYLLIFSFSPVQEFIKSSRKFLDFWAGSYLLHYLSVKLCWEIAQELGPDAVIVPSLWSQEVFDALIMKKYPFFTDDFVRFGNGQDPISRFHDKKSTSLSTAGFPNVITFLVPGKDAAYEWGKKLSTILTQEWVSIGEKVRKHIREQIIKVLNQSDTIENELLKEAFPDLFNSQDTKLLDPYRQEINKLKDERKQGCWEWTSLWEAQLNHTWEPYWTAIPLGIPGKDLSISKVNDLNNLNDLNNQFDQEWIEALNCIAQPPNELSAELLLYESLNVGTWWGSLQQRLRLALQSVKNTRNWEIPSAPGERSTISGQFTALHPLFNYLKFPEGGGVPAGSMRLFWLIMSKAYPGLFNGSERLNALEVTKRMAWVYGGVAESLGVEIELKEDDLSNDKEARELIEPEENDQEEEVESATFLTNIDYQQLVRFPNLSSIAAARFIYESPEVAQKYWQNLWKLFKQHKKIFSPAQRRAFYSKTRCPSQINNTDEAIKQKFPLNRGYNGVMFSSKWLIDDMGLQKEELKTLKNLADDKRLQKEELKTLRVKTLRSLVDKAHRDTGFFNGSPADWWVIVLADGDGMGDYISGKKLHLYQEYFFDSAMDKSNNNITELDDLLKTRKRMGPATHVGLNRALLDFSNRLVPYLTEKRFCGRVIYSGGDDVMAVLPLEDLPEYILSLHAAWCGAEDPAQGAKFSTSRDGNSTKSTGYWHPQGDVEGLPQRPLFTMGAGATISMGVVIAHKSVPLPTVLESLWDAEKNQAKEMPGKDGICFRVIYGGGNQLEALMKGELLYKWWDWVKGYKAYGANLSPLLYRLAEELPQRASVTETSRLFSQAAKVIMTRRDSDKQLDVFPEIEAWLDEWDNWANKCEREAEALGAKPEDLKKILGTKPEDLGKLLRFTGFWVDKRVERYNWGEL